MDQNIAFGLTGVLAETSGGEQYFAGPGHFTDSLLESPRGDSVAKHRDVRATQPPRCADKRSVINEG